MVKSQILPNKVSNPLLIKALSTVPRELFVKKEYENLAYADGILPLDHNRSIMPPLVFANLVEALSIQPDENVLDVAAGYGYSSAILGFLSKLVISLESDLDRSKIAKRLLEELNIFNVKSVSNPLNKGWLKAAPYDVIILEGVVHEVPSKLFEQLKDGGRLGALIAYNSYETPRATIFHKTNKTLTRKIVFEAEAPMIKELAPVKTTFVL
ncbi:protein-L-isoaspartate O-methyltransferase family protein [Candidatus Nucleicultrix amoebiphila]|nr:protein-L-isoaspartate O-methyltransferase [Candidatus Nucleicultrix amoebiphila]